MADEKRLIDANEAYEIARTSGFHNDFARSMADLTSLEEVLEDCTTVKAVEVVHGYEVGDVCFYGFYDGNKSLALVEIVKILSDERGVAEVKFLKVFVDNTGNGFFNYLLRSGNTMNASFKYLKNITPVGAKMDGGNEDV